MKIFKELKKIGYNHYTENTIEELDNLPLDSPERIMEQALVFRWFREKYGLLHDITLTLNVNNELISFYILIHKLNGLAINENDSVELNVKTIDKEEAELACLTKLIEIVESKSE